MSSPADRATAKATGSTQYFTGKPCKHGHIAHRRVCSGVCVECEAIYNKRTDVMRQNSINATRWNKLHPQRAHANARMWRLRHPELRKRLHAEWRVKNLEYTREKSRKSAAATRRDRPEVKRCHEALRRIRKHQGTPQWIDTSALMAVYKNCPPGMHVDHIVPIAGENVSGLHVPWNLQYLTPFENISKKNRFVHRYSQ